MRIDFETLRPKIAIALDVDPSEVTSTTVLSGHPGWDSLAMLTMVAAVTECTGRQLSVQDMTGVATIEDLIGLFQNQKGMSNA